VANKAVQNPFYHYLQETLEHLTYGTLQHLTYGNNACMRGKWQDGMQQRKREEVLYPYRTWYYICVSTGFASASFLWIQRVFRFAYLRKPVYL